MLLSSLIEATPPIPVLFGNPTNNGCFTKNLDDFMRATRSNSFVIYENKEICREIFLWTFRKYTDYKLMWWLYKYATVPCFAMTW
jgi:hypothetical protein